MQCSHIHSSLQTVFTGQPWYGDSILKKLQQVVPELAFRKPDPRLPSIWQIVMHMVAWREFAVENIKSSNPYDIEVNGKIDWPEIPGDDFPIHWENALLKLNNTQESLLEILSTRSDAWLSKPVPGREYSFGFLMEGIIQHDVYHLGQIAYVHKLLT